MLSGKAATFETYQRLSSGCSLSTSTFLALTWVSITTKNHSVAALVLAVAVVAGRMDEPARGTEHQGRDNAICFLFITLLDAIVSYRLACQPNSNSTFTYLRAETHERQ